MKRSERWGAAHSNDADRIFRTMNWREQLEQLDRQWVFRTPENEALWQTQKATCWQCVYAACMQYRGEYTYDERAEAVLLIMKELEKYDPEKYQLQESCSSSSPLVAYTLRLLRQKLSTAYTQGMDIEYDAPGAANKGRIAFSLDQPVKEDDSDEETATYGSLLADPLEHRRNNLFAKDGAAAVILSFLAQIANFDTCQKGQRKNETRRLHYSLCFTEQIACFAMQGGFRRTLESSPRLNTADIIHALRHSYLAFFCREVPRNPLLALEKIPLKRRCDCFPADPTEQNRTELLLWKDNGFLEAKVPIAYLKSAEDITTGNGEISRYRDDYITDTKKWIGKLGYDYTILNEIG